MFLYYSSLFQWKIQLVILPVFWQYLYYDRSLCMTRRNSPGWGSCGFGGCQARRWMGWLPFVGQALESVTGKEADILCEDLASSQIWEGCWASKSSRFRGESAWSQNICFFSCYGFLAKDSAMATIPSILSPYTPNHQLTHLNSYFPCILLITFNLVNSSLSFSSRALLML